VLYHGGLEVNGVLNREIRLLWHREHYALMLRIQVEALQRGSHLWLGVIGFRLLLEAFLPLPNVVPEHLILNVHADEQKAVID